MSDIMKGDVWKTINVPASEMLLLVCCADTIDDNGVGLWASDEYLNWKTNLPLRTIQAIKKKWRESGVLVPIGLLHLASQQFVPRDVNVRRGSGGRGWVVVYQLCLDTLPKKESWHQPRPKKVAIAATFNDGQTTPENGKRNGQNDGQKVADSGREGRNGAHQKVAMAAPEGRNRAQRNKEEPEVEPEGETTTAAPFPHEVAIGLREMEPTIDDGAICQIWEGCRRNTPDCTAADVMEIAQSRWKTFGSRIENPIGLLIRAVPQACTPALLNELRKQRRWNEQFDRERAERQTAEQQAAEYWRRERAEKEAQARADLETMAPEDREQLRLAIGEQLAQKHLGAWRWPNFAELVEGIVLKELMGENTDYPVRNVARKRRHPDGYGVPFPPIQE